MKFNFRLGSLEVRSCGKNLMQDEEHDTAEIIYWFDDNDVKGTVYCYTIAYWEKDSTGYALRFVRDRPIQHIDEWDDLKIVALYGQKDLNVYFEECKKEKKT